MSQKKKILVTGAGGFIGHHLVRFLKNKDHWVRGTDLKYPEFSVTEADDFIIGDLREQSFVRRVIDRKFDEVYQLAADMGGAGYVFTGKNDANIMHNSGLINLNIVEACYKRNIKKIFYSSSACIYPEDRQLKVNNPSLKEKFAYPANPDSEYGWEKLFSERMYLSFSRNYNLDVKIARFHNIYGPEGSWNDGKEKAPAAISRKIAMAKDGDKIKVWGNGSQVRTFLYIDECLKGIQKLMNSSFSGPVNIGSNERISINNLVKMVAKIANKDIKIKNIPEINAIGVKSRSSDNKLIKEKLHWEPNYPLKKGMEKTYAWIKKQVEKS
jgi:GDP-D-mannose 3', 5'-epimerase